MRAHRLVLAAAVALAAAGCSSDNKNPFDPPKPLDRMTKAELCDYYKFYLSDPSLMAETRATATRKMHEKGCPG